MVLPTMRYDSGSSEIPRDLKTSAPREFTKTLSLTRTSQMGVSIAYISSGVALALSGRTSYAQPRPVSTHRLRAKVQPFRPIPGPHFDAHSS